MDHLQGVGMQRRTGNQSRVLSSIQPVSRQGTTDKGHVDTQLVGSSGFRQQLQEGQAV